MTRDGFPVATTTDCEISPVYLERARVRGKMLEFDIVAADGASLAAGVGDSLDVFVHTVTDTAARIWAALPRAVVTATGEGGSFPLIAVVDLTEPMVEEPDGPTQPALVLRDFLVPRPIREVSSGRIVARDGERGPQTPEGSRGATGVVGGR